MTLKRRIWFVTDAGGNIVYGPLDHAEASEYLRSVEGGEIVSYVLDSQGFDADAPIESVEVTPIALEVIKSRRVEHHFVVFFTRPGRVEVTLINDHLHAMVYEGARVDMDQECLGAYDGALHRRARTDWQG